VLGGVNRSQQRLILDSLLLQGLEYTSPATFQGFPLGPGSLDVPQLLFIQAAGSLLAVTSQKGNRAAFLEQADHSLYLRGA
jgi:hypothetical protein